MTQIKTLTQPIISPSFTEATISLDDRLMATISNIVVDNQQLRTDATLSMQHATASYSPTELLKTMSIIGDYKIHTEILLAWAREINKGIETLIKT